MAKHEEKYSMKKYGGNTTPERVYTLDEKIKIDEEFKKFLIRQYEGYCAGGFLKIKTWGYVYDWLEKNGVIPKGTKDNYKDINIQGKNPFLAGDVKSREEQALRDYFKECKENGWNIQDEIKKIRSYV